MCMKELSERIDKQESKDRYVAKRVLNEMVNNGWGLQIEGTKDPYCPVDLTCTATSKYNNIYFNVEIKERYKSETSLKLDPYAELKDSKVRRMRRVTDYDTTKLYYLVLLNNKWALLYDLDEIDWEEIETFMWHIKKTQLDDNSEYEDVLCYKLPWHLAKKKIDCSKFYKELN